MWRIEKHQAKYNFHGLLRLTSLCLIINLIKAKPNYHLVESKVLTFLEAEHNLRHLSIISFDDKEKEVKKMIYQFLSSHIVAERGIRLSVHLNHSARNSTGLDNDRNL